MDSKIVGYGSGSGLSAAIVLLASTLLYAQDPPVFAAQVGQWNGYEGTYTDLTAEGNYVYMGNYAIVDGNPAQILVINISDPVRPNLEGTLFIPPPNQFASPQDVMVVDGLLYVALEGDGNDAAAIVDVRAPSNPVLLATVKAGGLSDTHNVFFEGGYLYMCDNDITTVVIVDLRHFDADDPPPSPITTAKWTLDEVGNSKAHEICVVNDRLYVAAWDSGLWVYDVTDIATTPPEFLGSVSGQATHSMWPTADGRYVVTGEERSGGGIKVFEVIEDGPGLDFVLRDTWTLYPNAYCTHNQVVIGHRLYCSWYQAGLQVFDIDPETGQLSFRSSFDTNDFKDNDGTRGNWGVYPLLGEDRIVTSDKDQGLHIIAIEQDDCAPTVDCNRNRVSDTCDMVVGSSSDCNLNFVPDECDLGDGTSLDCQSNDVPDECEVNRFDSEEIQILVDDIPQVNENFGESVAMSGEWAMVGVPSDHIGADNYGGVEVFRFDGRQWLAVAKLHASDQTPINSFGGAVSMGGGRAVVGATLADNSGKNNAGAAFVFRIEDDEWVEEATLFSADPSLDDGLGSSVGIDGDVVVCGAQTDDHSGFQDAGSAYVFRFDGANWVQEAQFTASDSAKSDYFGSSVAIDGDVIVVGAHLHNSQGISDSGAAYVFRYDGQNWIEEAMLQAAAPSAQGNFGNHVAIEGNRIAVGASWEDHAGDNTAGAAYVFEYLQGQWIQQANVTASDGDTNLYFGSAVAIDYPWLLVGATGAYDTGKSEAGAVYVFRHNGSEWFEHSKLTSSSPGTHVYLGGSVATENGKVLSGARQAEVEDGPNSSGTVHYFELPEGNCNGNIVPDACEADCNANLVPDDCDLLNGTSLDEDGNGIPDECLALPCDGDVNGDNLVDPLDSGYVLSRLNCPVGQGDPTCAAADVNADGIVDPLDVGFVLSRLGTCP